MLKSANALLENMTNRQRAFLLPLTNFFSCTLENNSGIKKWCREIRM